MIKNPIKICPSCRIVEKPCGCLKRINKAIRERNKNRRLLAGKK